MRLPKCLLGLTAGAAFALAGGQAAAQSGEPIKVGVLHSLSGTMAISETTLKDTVEMMVSGLNDSGGLLGRPVETVVVDPASDWDLFAEKARQLIEVEDVNVVFGCWTSASRKAVLPVFEELNGLLFYPVQYEGQEASKNIFYTGAAPNQQSIPATKYLLDQGFERFALLGTDYVFPRTTNKILDAYLNQNGIPDADIMVNYTPFGHSDWQSIISRVKSFANQGKRTAVISTINGDANVPFYKELANQGVDALDIPVVAFSVGEQELSGIDTDPLIGHLAAWNYFMSVETPQNDQFIENFREFTGDQDRVVNDPMEAHYIGFNMWVQAVRQAQTTDVEAVRNAMYGQTVQSLSGYEVEMNENHHLSKPVMIGEIGPGGQFNIVQKTDEAIPGDPWSDYLAESENLTADWTYPWVCGGCEEPTFADAGLIGVD
ncbi:urea ABC transporter substrate-binding protein [Rhodovibrio sodomensis]|uniref:Urea ABC transporter substrate-binding protein n=1 Tax=Rhodovibrio sodomensis TaxID=1088 RepID=A0ABS1D9X7_9PROT|nr:urea ABC transporter substrate-binding protein [Rhodovibrio sodomensis]MBK1667165.1 urea ABC transporter substrate-binding protein [Rhodovibrio sodomensis]